MTKKKAKATPLAARTSHPGAGLPVAARTTRASRKALPTCGATSKRTGQPCSNAAGFRTDHPGTGRCYLHGGVGQKPEQKHAQLIETTDSRLGDLIEAYSNDPNLLDLSADVALLRALVARHIERHDARETALLSWHGAWGGNYLKARDEWMQQIPLLMLAHMPPEDWPEPPHPDHFPGKPLQLPDISDVYKLVDKVGAMAQRIHDTQKQSAISLERLNAILDRLGSEVVEAAREVIADEATRAKLLAAVDRRWDGLDTDTIPEATPEGVAPGSGTARTVN